MNDPSDEIRFLPITSPSFSSSMRRRTDFLRQINLHHREKRKKLLQDQSQRTREAYIQTFRESLLNQHQNEREEQGDLKQRTTSTSNTLSTSSPPVGPRNCLVVYDWLIQSSLPPDLNTAWFVFARPSGKRRLLIWEHGKFDCRDIRGGRGAQQHHHSHQPPPTTTHYHQPQLLGQIKHGGGPGGARLPLPSTGPADFFFRHGLTVLDCILIDEPLQQKQGPQQHHHQTTTTTKTTTMTNPSQTQQDQDYYAVNQTNNSPSLPNNHTPPPTTTMTTILDQPLHTLQPYNTSSRRHSHSDNAANASPVHFHILDILWWNDIPLMDSSTECRAYFLKSRFEESTYMSAEYPFYSFSLCDLRECSADALTHLYHTARTSGGAIDSVVFVHKEAHYVTGFSPLWLCWKDDLISRFCIDTSFMPSGRKTVQGPKENNVEANAAIDERLLVCLQVGAEGELVTADGVCLDRVSLDPNSTSVRPGDVVRVSLGSLQFTSASNSCVETRTCTSLQPLLGGSSSENSSSTGGILGGLGGVSFSGSSLVAVPKRAPSSARGFRLFRQPDPLHRILFQYYHRRRRKQQYMQQQEQLHQEDFDDNHHHSSTTVGTEAPVERNGRGLVEACDTAASLHCMHMEQDNRSVVLESKKDDVDLLIDFPCILESLNWM